MCLHSEASSFLLFNDAIFGLHMMKYFSLRHKLQALLDAEYGFALVMTFQVILYLIPLSLRDQMYLLKAVLVLSFDLNDAVCLSNLSLKVSAVSPM